MAKENKFADEIMSDEELDGVVGGITKVDGKILEALPNSMFQVDLENGQKVLATK